MKVSESESEENETYTHLYTNADEGELRRGLGGAESEKKKVTLLNMNQIFTKLEKSQSENE